MREPDSDDEEAVNEIFAQWEADEVCMLKTYDMHQVYMTQVNDQQDDDSDKESLYFPKSPYPQEHDGRKSYQAVDTDTAQHTKDDQSQVRDHEDHEDLDDYQGDAHQRNRPPQLHVPHHIDHQERDPSHSMQVRSHITLRQVLYHYLKRMTLKIPPRNRPNLNQRRTPDEDEAARTLAHPPRHRTKLFNTTFTSNAGVTHSSSTTNKKRHAIPEKDGENEHDNNSNQDPESPPPRRITTKRRRQR
jgi:hypothetical protein